MKELWIVEWSDSQQVYHIDTLKNTAEKNLRPHLLAVPNDWNVVGYADTQREATEFMNRLKVERQRLKQAA